MLGHLLSLLVGAALIFRFDRATWFFQDEWDFFNNRVLPPLSGGLLLVPHNEHWTAVPALAYRLVFDVVGLRTYVPYLAIDVLAHLVVCHLLWRLMRRAGAAAPLATAATAVFAVLGAGSGNLTVAFQVTFVGALMFGLGALLVADRPGTRLVRSDVAVCVLEILAVMCSGVGVAMVLAVAMSVLLRRGWRAAVVLAAVPGVVYVAWYASYGRQGYGGDHVTLATVLGLPAYAWQGLTTALGDASGIPASGTVLLLVLVAYGVRQAPRFATAVAPALATATGALGFYLITGLGRLQLGVDQSTASRYTYIAVALLLPLGVLALSDLCSARPSRLLTVVGVGALVWVSSVSEFRTEAGSVASAAQLSKAQVLAAAQILRSGQRTFGDTPEPAYAPPLSSVVLSTFARRQDLPVAFPPSMPARLGAELALLVGDTTTPAGDSRSLTMPGPSDTPGSCVRLAGPGSFPLTFSAPSSVRIVAAEALSVPDSLSNPDATVTSALPDHLALPAGTSYLDGNLVGRTLFLALGASQVIQICPVAPGA